MTSDSTFIGPSVFWGASVFAVLVTGIIYFPLEVDGLSFWGALYYSIRLFILEHDIPHFPTRAPLIFIYFFAPVLSLSAIGTAISYIYRSTPQFWSRLKKNHVIICGVGRTGKLVFSTLCQEHITVVGIDKDKPEAFEDFISKYNASMIYGDFLSMKSLSRAGIKNAGHVVFASSDDLLNLEGAIGLFSKLDKNLLVRTLTIWVHISDDSLTETAKDALKDSGNIRIRFFDTFNIAGIKTVEKHFNKTRRKGIDKITLLGFGEFGNELMKALIADAGDNEKWLIDVVDVRDRSKDVFKLADKLNIRSQTTFTQADIMDIEFEESQSRAVFLCTDDDIRNLSTALLLTRENKGAFFYIRMAMWPLSAVKDRLGNERRLRFININSLVREGIRDIKHLLQ